MRNPVLKLHCNWPALSAALKNENGWDMAEYTAAIMIVALGLTAGVSGLAGAVNNVMTYVVSIISNMGSFGSEIGNTAK